MLSALAAGVARLRDRGGVVALVAVIAAIQLFPRHVPGGIYGLGLVSGSATALYAAGLLLAHRASRVVNFAQIQIGVLTATLFAVLVHYRPLLELLDAGCPPCQVTATPALVATNYAVALALSLLVAMLVSQAMHALVVRRLVAVAPLMATIATLFVAQLLAGLGGLLPSLLTTAEQREQPIQLGAVPPPFEATVHWAPARFHAPEILTVAIAALVGVGLMLYLRRSATGTALRATADNPERAATVGIPIRTVTGRAWVLSGALSGAAGILSAMTLGPPSDASLDAAALVPVLAAAVIGRLTSVPTTMLAALTLGVLVQSVLWSFDSTAGLDAALLVVIAVALSLQRPTSEPASRRPEDATLPAVLEARPVPAQLRGLPAIRRIGLVGGAVVVALLLAYPWVMSPTQTNIGARAMIVALVAVSLLVLTGWAGQISLGQFGLAAVGGYVAAASHLPFVAALVVGGLAGAAVAALLGLPALRLRGPHLAVVSLAFAVAAPTVLLVSLGDRVGRSLQRPAVAGIDFADARSFYYLVLSTLVAVVVVAVGIRRSPMGRALIASRDSESVAEAFGINLFRTRLAAFAVSGFVAALAGALFVYQQAAVRPDTFAAEQSVTVFVIAVIGGLGSVAGPLLGALYFGVLEVLAANPVAAFLASGGGGLAVLLLMPGGLAELAFRLRDSALAAFARRRGIHVDVLVGTAAGGRRRAPITPPRRSGAAAVAGRYRLDGQQPGDGQTRRADRDLESTRG